MTLGVVAWCGSQAGNDWPWPRMHCWQPSMETSTTSRVCLSVAKKQQLVNTACAAHGCVGLVLRLVEVVLSAAH